MKNTLTILFILFSNLCYAQVGTITYLKLITPQQLYGKFGKENVTCKEFDADSTSFMWYEVKYDDYVGIYSEIGKEIIKPDKFFHINAPVYYKGKLYFFCNGDFDYPYTDAVYDYDGNIVIPQSRYSTMSRISQRYISFSKNENISNKGVCRIDGKEILPPVFNDVSYEDGFLEACKGWFSSDRGAYDLDGNLLIPCIYSDIKYESGSFWVKSYSNDEWVKYTSEMKIKDDDLVLYNDCEFVVNNAIEDGNAEQLNFAYRFVYQNLDAEPPTDGEIQYKFALLCEKLSKALTSKAFSMTNFSDFALGMELSANATYAQALRNIYAAASKISGYKEAELLCIQYGLYNINNADIMNNLNRESNYGRSREQIQADIDKRTELMQEAIGNRNLNSSISGKIGYSGIIQRYQQQIRELQAEYNSATY